MARRPARAARKSPRKSGFSGRRTARRTGVRSGNRSTSRRTAVKRQQTIRIVVETGPSGGVARPDVTESALLGAQVESGKRRAKL